MRVFLFFTVLILALFGLSGCPSQADIERKISQSKELTHLNDLCKRIPLFPGSRFTKKQIGGNSEIRTIEFQFKKDKIDDEAVEKFYRQWAETNQWERIDDNMYRSQGKTVVIGYSRNLATNYQVTCQGPK